MEMNPALSPHLLSPAGSSPGTIRTGEDGATRVPGPEPAAGNIAFYFRNWPFPVDMAEATTGDGSLRSWQERLASYREASKTAARERPRPAEEDALALRGIAAIQPAEGSRAAERDGVGLHRPAVEEAAPPGRMLRQEPVGWPQPPGELRKPARGAG